MREMFEAVEAIVSPVYLVGGSVRDAIMGRQCNDYDFCTPLDPDAIEAAIRAARQPESGHNYRVFTTGKKFGTLAFKVNGELVEVTTFRTETYVEGSRKPQVEFVSDINFDLSRRDFTMNAMAYRDGSIIDPFGGAKDIEDGIIRAVGNPTRRFKEDPLRMLRAARFASQFGFDIDPAIYKSAKKLAQSILGISKERWMAELDKMLVSPHPRRGLQFLADTGLLMFMMPELAIQVGYDQNSKYHSLPLWEHTLQVVEGVPADIDLRWAALLHDIGKPATRTLNTKTGYHNYVMHEMVGAEMVEKLAFYLKWAIVRRDMVRKLVREHLTEDSPLKEADDAAKAA